MQGFPASPAVERVYIERGEGKPRCLLGILGRRQEGRFAVLELAPQRRRCHQGACERLVDVPRSYCLEHERRAA